MNGEASWKIDLERVLHIWKWLLDPEQVERPENLTKEELLGVYGGNMALMLNFKKVVDSTGRLYRTLDIGRYRRM